MASRRPEEFAPQKTLPLGGEYGMRVCSSKLCVIAFGTRVDPWWLIAR